MENAPSTKPHVVIVGAGFGGLEAAKKLGKEAVRVTVIDRTNHHLFQPLLYEVATAALSPADIAAPIRGILSDFSNTEVILAEVKSVDVAAKTVNIGSREIAYDYLILATGSRHSYFGHDEWEKLAPGLKSLEDAVEIRRRLLLAFEYAEKITDEAAKAAAMTFVIIGGGPTGVEMAGAIAEIARYTLAKDFRHIDPASARVVLVEGDQRVLSSFPEDLSVSAMEQLKQLGVEVRTGIHAKNLTDAGLEVGDEFIPCRLKIWAAGNAASFVGKTIGVPVDKAGRVIVNEDLTIPGHPRSPGDWRSGEFFPSGRQAAPRRFARRHATGPSRRAQYPGDDRWPEAPALSLLGQRKHGDDRPEQSGRGLEFHPLERAAGLAGVAFRPHHFSGGIPQSHRRADAMGLGLRHF